ncbi:hypothetical protein GR217_34395 [Rhizobium leguminosarum]|uniref:Class I SAM-dependent methyltransferase n=1 Tax=Rhizobium ruizarguesonis TaxID=2081791 RepID=A0AAE4YXA3_9HYPH|nr:class I SAM-dependent methyltransferase [Rhizobium ruizarguesonis]NEI52711.1 hypothetical protein [Rhizobium ruizarguesonis]
MKTREYFLADMARKLEMRRFAELGLWKGRTFFHLLDTCPSLSIIGVDAWIRRPNNTAPGAETYKQWNMDGLRAHVTTKAKDYGDRAQILIMETHEAAAHVEDGSLCGLFIDADHSEAGCRRDIELWRPKLKPGGMLAGHDIDWPTVKAAVSDMVPGYQVAQDNVWWTRV